MTAQGTARGASPAGVEPENEAEAARVVREMFGRVAPRYDLLNHLLSGHVDRYWRRRLVREVRRYLAKDSARVADLCCGTGDLALALERERVRLGKSGGPPLLAADFCRPMLRRAKQKMSRAGYSCLLAEADATRMPLPDSCLELITVAYGLRNLTNYLSAAREFVRLLAGGGCLAVLEFSRPTSVVWGKLFEAYFRHVLPRLGNAISGSGGAYSYLHESVQRFPGPDEVRRLLLDAGFARVETRSLTGGVSILYLAYVQGSAD